MAGHDLAVNTVSADVLVVGGGIAAVRAALAAREAGAAVRLVTKRRLLTGGASAVGRSEIMGVAAALGHAEPRDCPEVHYQDTVTAGGPFCHPDLVRVLVEDIPGEIHNLMRMGVPFERKGEKLHQTRSDYATYPRNCRVDGRTGYEILWVLVGKLKQAGIAAEEEVMMARLFPGSQGSLAAVGLSTKSNTVTVYEAKTVVAACGGSAALFSHQAVSPEMSGDGYVFALEAGARLVNMEFLQFGPGLRAAHWCALSGPVYRLSPRFTNSKEEDILQKHLPPGVAAAEVLTHKVFPFNGENPSRYLDASIYLEQMDGEAVRVRFPDPVELLRRIPHTVRRMLDAGFSPDEPWPVAIVLQCFNGGIYMEDACGRTGVPGLFTAGEAAGGLRAPTRPGGNALAEALVFGKRAGGGAAREAADRLRPGHRPDGLKAYLSNLSEVQASRRGRSHLAIRREIQALGERYLSVIRWAEGLAEARRRIQELSSELESEGSGDGFLADFVTTRHLAVVAEVVAAAAATRAETRGSHYRKDFEHPRDEMNVPLFITKTASGLRVDARRL